MVMLLSLPSEGKQETGKLFHWSSNIAHSAHCAIGGADSKQAAWTTANFASFCIPLFVLYSTSLSTLWKSQLCFTQADPEVNSSHSCLLQVALAPSWGQVLEGTQNGQFCKWQSQWKAELRKPVYLLGECLSPCSFFPLSFSNSLHNPKQLYPLSQPKNNNDAAEYTNQSNC